MDKDIVIFDIKVSCEDKDINPHYNMETIAIGAIKVRHANIVDTFEILIRPEYVDKLTDYCMRLTGITYADLECSPVFNEAILKFYNFIYGCNIYSFGDFDRKFLIRELEEKGFSDAHELARNAIHSSHTDLKGYYNKITGRESQGVLEMASELGIQLTDDSNGGLVDSLTLTKIYLKLEDMRADKIAIVFNEETMRTLVLNLNANHDYDIVLYEDMYIVDNEEYGFTEFIDLMKDVIVTDIEIRGLSYLSQHELAELKRLAK